ncbi:hypothetical protein ACFE04_023582 [Oxalis oulophora]
MEASFFATIADAAFQGSSGGARVTFQWGATIFALMGQRSGVQTNLLALYLFASLPTALFKILRGEFGCYISFPAVAANLFFPETYPVSRFVLFVVTPDCVANELRDGSATVTGGFCLVIGILLIISEIKGIRNCECNLYCFGKSIGVVFLLFFTILYLCSG